MPPARIEVPGLVVAKQGWENAALFELDGQQILIRPTAGRVLGTILRKDHRIVREHPEFFTELVIQPEFED
jgi:hypothetical protein